MGWPGVSDGLSVDILVASLSCVFRVKILCSDHLREDDPKIVEAAR